MRLTRTILYKSIVAVIFGLIGFAVNFGDFRLIDGEAFKISILLGLFFPLIVAMAWGLGYGLLSALAGGCQSMWWLWQNDGWGILYAVPVFTLWIGWHGWWAERQRPGSPWYRSCFAVEIPFRLLVESGFYTIFPWLVSLNPPPWDPAITWDQVSMAWIHTVVIKHILTGYILLLCAYTALNLDPIRRFFRLGPAPSSQESTVIFAGALLMGLVLWIADTLADYLAFNPQGKTFWELAILEVGPHHMFMRMLFILLSLAGAALIVRLVRHRARLARRLNHINQVLSAIRNINQLITHEKDRHRLLDQACELLTQSRGFYNAWIVLLESGRPVSPFFHTGFSHAFAPMIKRLQAGHLPDCAHKALESGALQIMAEPAHYCPLCPLADQYPGSAGAFTIRLEHSGQVFGWLSASLPRAAVEDSEEQALFAEISRDLAFALHQIENAEALSESEARFRQVYEHMAVGVARVSMDFHIQSANEAYCRMLGYTEAELVGKHLKDITHPEVVAENLNKQARLARGEINHYRMEKRFIHKNGQVIYGILDANLIRDAQGRPAYFFGSVVDISDRKRAEERLARERNLFNAILDNIPILITRYDPRANILYLNQEFEKQVGWSTEEARNIDLMEAVYPDPDYRRTVFEYMQKASIDWKEFQVHTKSGRILQTQWSNIRLDDGTRIGIGIDITERKQAEQERARLEEQFHQAQKLESIGRLAGGVAHDLNNLLTPILGYGELLLDEAARVDPRREPLEQILNAGLRARNLVRQLLAFSRKQTLEFKPLDLNLLLKDFEKLLRRTIREDIAIQMELKAELPFIKGDRGQLEQVVMNLAVNGQDAMPDGGELCFQTGLAELDKEYAAHHQGVIPGEYVMLSVSDTGCGMDGPTLEKLFEPFFTTKSRDKGTGLGLATVYGIIKQHGGNIWTYSEPGLGTTFNLYLPVAGESPEADMARESQAKAGGGSETILVAEDNPEVRKLAVTILKQQGYTVLEADSGKEALRRYQDHSPPIDLLLTDVVMPEMDGKQLYEQLSHAWPALRVLYMSGYSHELIAQRGAMGKGVHFIQKPFSVKGLSARVREVLEA